MVGGLPHTGHWGDEHPSTLALTSIFRSLVCAAPKLTLEVYRQVLEICAPRDTGSCLPGSCPLLGRLDEVFHSFPPSAFKSYILTKVVPLRLLFYLVCSWWVRVDKGKVAFLLWVWDKFARLHAIASLVHVP